jgi:hypothetical protein
MSVRRAVTLKRKSRLLAGQYSHGPASECRTLSADERAEVEQAMRERGLLNGAARPPSRKPGLYTDLLNLMRIT